MEQIDTITFYDDESGDDALIIVRAKKGLIALGLSLMSNGDLEVFIKQEEFQRLLVALQQAASVAEF